MSKRFKATTRHELVTERELLIWAQNARFGSTPLREVLDRFILCTAMGFSNGSTITEIARDIGLVTKATHPKLTQKGFAYARLLYIEADVSVAIDRLIAREHVRKPT